MTKLTKEDIKVGAELYVQTIRSYGQSGPATVTSVGRKYFKVKVGYQEITFHLDTLREKSNLTQVYFLHASEEVYKAGVYHAQLNDKVRNHIYNSGTLPLDQLEAIANIIDLDLTSLKGE